MSENFSLFKTLVPPAEWAEDGDVGVSEVVEERELS